MPGLGSDFVRTEYSLYINSEVACQVAVGVMTSQLRDRSNFRDSNSGLVHEVPVAQPPH